jgi:hypothetical protein
MHYLCGCGEFGGPIVALLSPNVVAVNDQGVGFISRFEFVLRDVRK